MKHKHYYIFHYISLFILLTSGFIFYYLSSGFPQKQFLISVGLAVLYVFWGIIHHSLKGDLHPRIVIEYSLIALLGVIIVRGALMH